MSWHALLPVAELPPGSLRCVEAGGRRIAVGHGPEGYFALDDVCPHAGASLSEGLLDGSHLVCPLHAFAYHVHSGACEEGSEPVTAFAVRVADERLEVELPA